MSDNFVIISKDALCIDYLPVYGNKQWKTPNISELAEKGTVFERHYTAAPSTVMSFFSMITGQFAHETPYEMYDKIKARYEGDTLFSKLKNNGYDCHILWGDIWKVLPEYFDCYRDDVTIHSIDGFKQGVGAHYVHDGFLSPSKEIAKNTFLMIKKELDNIFSNQKVFLWIHFPHVINGEVSYGSDIELFDEYVGLLRQYVEDDKIVITADHGNMNGHKGKIGYGYDVYEPAIRIPLITPYRGCRTINHITSSVDLYSIVFENKIPERKYIYSDCAYRAQPHRKLAIISQDYKYIYNKKSKTEELYDIIWDPNEDFSLISDYILDPDRKLRTPARELYYYPKWNELEKVRAEFRKERNRIWKHGSVNVVIKSTIKEFVRPLFAIISKKR